MIAERHRGQDPSSLTTGATAVSNWNGAVATWDELSLEDGLTLTEDKWG